MRTKKRPIKSFTRYKQFETIFEVSLKDYAQDKVKRGAKGDYLQLLYNLRNLLEDKSVIYTQPMLDEMRKLKICTSRPGLVQVLKGLGIIKKVEGKHYSFLVNRIDYRLSEFVFQYNQYKQIILNGDKNDEHILAIKVALGEFEEYVSGKNTFQIKGKTIPIN